MGCASEMKIGVFSQFLPPFPGAASLRAASVIGGLRSRGGADLLIEVHTTTAGAAALGSRVQIEVVSDADIDNVGSLSGRLLGELRLGWRAGGQLVRSGADLIVISSPAYLAALVIAWRARRRGIPYLLDIRDVYPQVYAHANLLKMGSIPYRLMLSASRHFYRGAVGIITATRGLAQTVRPDAREVPIHCVYNGFPASLAALREPKHERFSVCFHGVMGFFQDVPTLVKVAEALQAHDVDVVAIGYGRQAALLKDSTLSNLRFLGKLPFEQTVVEASRCHVGLSLRRDDDISKDAFPVKVWEYMALGLPQVVTPPCEAGDFIERHGCGAQCAAGDIDRIVALILDLKRRPELMAAQVQRCEVAGRGYTRESLGEEFAAIVLDSAARLKDLSR